MEHRKGKSAKSERSEAAGGFYIEVVRTRDQCPNSFGLVLVD